MQRHAINRRNPVGTPSAICSKSIYVSVCFTELSHRFHLHGCQRIRNLRRTGAVALSDGGGEVRQVELPSCWSVRRSRVAIRGYLWERYRCKAVGISGVFFFKQKTAYEI